MFKIETKKALRSSLIAGVAVAASLATLGFASVASATEANPEGKYIRLEASSMVTSYTAYVGVSSANEHAYSNGVTFSYQNLNATGTGLAADTQIYTLFGFCIDVAHNMTLTDQAHPLNYTYSDTFGLNYPANNDPVPDSFLLNGKTWAGVGGALDKLIDTGWLLHEKQLNDYAGAGTTNAQARANIDLQLAAIQAAIWKTEGAFVNLGSEGGATAYANVGGAISGAGVKTYNDYFTAYSTGAFTNLGDANDKFYTILDTGTNPAHQGFAVGWPVPGVPEPATWAMMLTGFFGMGAMLRNRRKVATAAI